MPAIITLTTDYGARDPFTASVKGVILKVNPQAQIVDISNEITPHDVWEAAYVLKTAYSHFPKGTIHLAVVDPEVGSGRRPIIAVTESYYFVGPDNGIFSLVYNDAERLRVHHITSTHYLLPNPGPTFHGRDIFAPVAGWITRGIPSGNFGDEIMDFKRLNVPAQKVEASGVEGRVVHIDRFGNIITDILYKDVQTLLAGVNDAAVVSVQIAGREIKGLRRFYAEAVSGEPGAIFNSSGALEIFLFRQNARSALSVKRGEVVRLNISR